jgi:hypothetical protein
MKTLSLFYSVTLQTQWNPVLRGFIRRPGNIAAAKGYEKKKKLRPAGRLRPVKQSFSFIRQLSAPANHCEPSAACL